MTDLIIRDLPATRIAEISDGIAALYNGTLDIIVVREALPAPLMIAVGERLDVDNTAAKWAQPNQQIPSDDIQLLGTPATPTFSAPRGPSEDAYLQMSDWYEENPVFGADFDPARAITATLQRLAGGRPVEVLRFPNGRTFAPFTIRRLTEGKGISLHHDYHFPIPLFKDIAPQLDTRTLLSYFFTLRRPQAGGELFAYPVTPETPNPPKLPNGWAWDLPAVEQRFGSTPFATEPGDLFLFASARCLHRVAPTVGPRARITMGGFLALDKDDQRVWYWS
jgi:hypothetical protein